MCLVSWFGNWAGISIFLGFMIAAGNFEGSKNWYSVYLAEHKVHYGWGRVFVKGIFANWLVGIATWMANAAQDLTGKAVAIWWVLRRRGGGGDSSSPICCCCHLAVFADCARVCCQRCCASALGQPTSSSAFDHPLTNSSVPIQLQAAHQRLCCHRL
jgi:hypothetical protein